MKDSSLFFYKNIKRISISFFLCFFILQIIFQIKTEYIKPDIHVVPPVPNKDLVNAISLGDKEFYFRVLALKLQNAGDTFGRTTPLKNYDYKELYRWFTFMDSLNSDSRIVPSLASYYYSQTQNKADTIHVIRYLDEHASINVDKHWWWLYQAVHIAKLASNDDLALEMAYKLSENNAVNAPLWTRQLPAFLHAQMGNDCESFFIINQMLKDNESGKKKIKPEDMEFMRHFIKTRLSDFRKSGFDPRKCTKSRTWKRK